MKVSKYISKHNIGSYPKLKRYWDILDEWEKELLFDSEGLWSYIPQKLASEIAAHTMGAKCVVDLFCGVGGMAIGFAKAGKMVEAIDISKDRLKIAKLNVAKMGVTANVRFYHASALSFLANLQSAEVIFIDPPWGGEKYRQNNTFSFDNFLLDVRDILNRCIKISSHVILKLPFNFNLDELYSQNAKVKVIKRYIPSYKYNRELFLTAHYIT
jgi:trimethylguanosine synthase